MALLNDASKIPEHEEESTEQLLQAQAHIWNTMFSFINPMSLKCAIQLGIPDIIHSHGKPMAHSELIRALPVNQTKAQCIHRLMRILTHAKFFITLNLSNTSSQDEECYWLTPSSRLLLRDRPLNLAPLVLLELDPILTKPWDHMSEWLVSGTLGSAFEAAHGRKFWELAGEESNLNELFNQGMSCDARFIVHTLFKECKQVLDGIELVVDVGGGVGTMAKEIVDEFRGVKCIVLDLPHVVAGLEGTHNLTYIAGDMFESVPPADAILLKWILHNWKDEDCLRILKKCKEAITKKRKGTDPGKGRGKVIIIDMVLDEFPEKRDNEKMQTQLFFDMAMMALLNGKQRSEKEWAKLFTEAGFTSYKIYPSSGMRPLIEVYP